MLKAMEPPYIPRVVHAREARLHEDEALRMPGVVLVLAEPGAGKTEFLKHIAATTGGTYVRASIFRHNSYPSPPNALVVDALDEVARIDQSAIDAILVKVRDLGSARVVLASRSSEWDQARTSFATDCFGSDLNVIRLEPFNIDEQRTIFFGHFPEESFDDFLKQTDTFELSPLLGNPQFLQLFGEAYIEGGRKFRSKQSIYNDATTRLACERPDSPNQRLRPSVATLLKAAEGTFAKLMLSGASGVATVEHLGDPDYPYLFGDNDVPVQTLQHLLNTRLFKPAVEISQHDPVHRIVAEYGAAQCLSDRVSASRHTLSMRRVLAVVAPNSVVRDELRGMIGWLAALGDQSVQRACIDLDPYAVLANGDPSQLSQDSKLRLIRGLRELSQLDPYFRRSDAWRRFNASGFFDVSVVDDVRDLLTSKDDKSHLRSLILELLQGSAIGTLLTVTYRQILLDERDGELIRTLALRNLDPSLDYSAEFASLVRRGTRDDLALASEMVERFGSTRFERSQIFSLLERTADLLQTRSTRRSRDIGSSYFVGRLVSALSLDDVTQALEHLTHAINCTCEGSRTYTCSCRSGISNVCGQLLDRYFVLSTNPSDPTTIWRWTSPLIFNGHQSGGSNSSVVALSSDETLRREVQKVAVRDLSDPERIKERLGKFRFSGCHSGLTFKPGDLTALSDYAFETGNNPLWEALFLPHYPFSQSKGPDFARARMREQARLKPELNAIWARRDRQIRRALAGQRSRLSRRHKKWEAADEQTKSDNLAYLHANRRLIEAGQHWAWLKNFARFYLHFPDKLAEITGGDNDVAETALSNCLDFLSPHVPNLTDLSQGHGGHIGEVLYAASLAIFRRGGSLSSIPLLVLRVVKVEAGDHKEREEGERRKFEDELDNILFQPTGSAEAFAIEFLEPQLCRSVDSSTTIGMLQDKSVFAPIRGELSIRWLTAYPNMPRFARDELFEMAAMCAAPGSVQLLIQQRCAELGHSSAGSLELDEDRRFWFIRAFFFLDDDPCSFWDDLLMDPQTVFSIRHRSERYERIAETGWPPLNASKLFRVLDINVELWLEVSLPSSYGTGDPKEETAYRFLKEIPWHIGRDQSHRALPALDRILTDSRFRSFQVDAQSVRASVLRRAALQNFSAPSWASVSRMLQGSNPASVEDLRALIWDELSDMQGWLRSGETDPVDTFYSGQHRVDENTARNRIVDRLQNRFQSLNLAVAIERHMANSKRCDISATALLDGRQALLVVEVKGQWHPELFSAASEQLEKRYASHPDAASQGVYLVLWFGAGELVAGRRRNDINSADELKAELLSTMPDHLKGFIDVFVLDVSRKLP